MILLTDEEIMKLKQAARLLRVISAKFETDPMSVQCFDLRTVEEVKTVTKELTELRII